MYYSIISTYVRDDNDYLDEWVIYHLSIGFEHIVMYDHLSKVPVVNIWGDKVSVIRVERPSLFEPEYLNQLTLKSHPSYWMAMPDVDEFIVLLHDNDIKDFLTRYESHGAVGLCWSMFGSSGHITKPEGKVMDNYLWRRPDENPEWIKSIINTQYCSNIYDPHYGVYSVPAVNDNFEPIEGSRASSPRIHAKINHYFTRSLEEYKRKMERGTGSVNTPKRPIEWFYDLQEKSTIYDDTLLNYDGKE